LVGAGHAHLEVLRQQLLHPLPAELTLISAGSHHHYSGMVPGYLAGTYGEAEIAFDLAAIAGAASVDFVQERAIALHPHRRRVELADGSDAPYDLVSFNVGSRAAGSDREAVRTGAIGVKPMSEAVRLKRRLETLAETGDARRSIVVVGAGAAGFEVACAADRLLRDAGAEVLVSLVEAGSEILDGYSARFRRLARRAIEGRAIEIVLGRRVETVDTGSVSFNDGERLAADLTIWLTGAVSWPLFRGSGLSCDDRGFLLTDDSLRSIDDPRVFAVGDCGTMASHLRTPKAGVYAVRQGPVLAEALRSAVSDREPPTYIPQTGFLSLLNTADGKALLRWGGTVSWSRWAWWSKDWIDRRFMSKYQNLAS
jgi:selenide,water dikinase